MGIALAAVGLLNPLSAAFIHVTSEMTFILNSARLLPAADRNPIRSAEEGAENEALATAPLRPAQDHVLRKALSAANTATMGEIATVARQARSASLVTR